MTSLTGAATRRKDFVTLCANAYDTLKDKPQETYATISIRDIAAMVKSPQAVEKSSAAFIIPSSYNFFDARSHDVQRQSGRFQMLTFDVDEGNHSLDDLIGAMDTLIANHAYMIYSSASAAADRQKWRIMVPLAEEVSGGEFAGFQMAAYDLMLAASGIKCDPALSRPAQPVYLPNVPPTHRGDDGQPIFYKWHIHSAPRFDVRGSAIDDHAQWKIRMQEEAEANAREERERRAAERAERRKDFTDDIDPVEEFNARHSVSDTLLRYGFERQGASKNYRSPFQTSGSYATKDFGTHWVSLSGSDDAAGLGALKGMGEFSYRWGDAFDLYCHFEHGGDMKKAVREYAQELKGPRFEEPRHTLDDFDFYDGTPAADPDAGHDSDLDDFDDFDDLPKVAQDIPEFKADEPDEGVTWPTPLTMFDEMALPRRQWIYGYDYIRKYVTVLASAGGIGKTSLVLVEALAICTGRDLLGEHVKEQTKTWVINLEDPVSEMQIRTLAAMKHHGLTSDEVRGNLFLDGEDTMDMLMAAEGRDGVMKNDAMLKAMKQKIVENGIGCVIIDPFVSTHAVNENANGSIQQVVAMFRELARDTNCAVLLVHHIRKANGEDATIDHVRGAGALIGAARAARVVNKVSVSDAIELGVDERDAKGIFRVDDGKANLAAPADTALYRRMIGVQLDNEEWVGVAVEFKLPDPFSGISARDTRRVQDAIGGAEDEGKPCRAAVQSPEWVGVTVGRILDIDVTEAKGRKRVSRLIREWLRTDVLRVITLASSSRKGSADHVIVGEWIKPEEIS